MFNWKLIALTAASAWRSSSPHLSMEPIKIGV